ncbi:MAG: peptide MFS transporter [Acidobacteriia bacterium]|nr:peptide MFS transporter [Terriglobia bacterium]
MESRTDGEVRDDTRFFGHPRGLATLFFTEMWERFSYYGMRAILILYMVAPVSTGGLGFSVAKGGAVYGFYTAMVYLLGLPGGWVADRITGQQKAVLYGGVLISAGEFCLAAPGMAMFYLGLVFLMMGTGLLKPNVSTIVGQLYPANDVRRDSGFSIFYMGINVGALISPLICGYIGERVNWRMGFGVAGIGMLAGLIQYMLSGKYLGKAGLHPTSTGDPAEDRRQKRHGLLAGLGALAALATVVTLSQAGIVAITAETISDALGWFLLVISAAVFAWLILGRGWSPVERKRAVATLVIFMASAIFWGAYEQAGSSLNLFAERNTNRMLLGWEFPASWFQFVQPVFVIALAPVFAWLWIALRRKEPSIPTKFSFGLLLGGLAFVILIPAAGGKLVSPWWLTGTYFLQTLGELCLSPVGLSAMTKLAPARVGGFMMGVWFLSVSIGDWAAGKAASFYESMPLTQLFGTVAGLSLAAVVLLALMIRPTVRWMAGVK